MYIMQQRKLEDRTYIHYGDDKFWTGDKHLSHPTAYWDATRAFMILSLLACFIGIVIGIMAFIHYSSFDGFDKTFAAGILFFISCFFVLLAMAVYTGVTVNYYGKRYGSWRFSWSYIMGWVAVVLTFFSGIFYMCAYRMHECPRNSNSR
uniref:Lens intrinsic membrane protein 2.3 n=1 Tax=Poecilia mexicana TaxID=48701 RepID=A0A3B3XM70_9TELE